MKLNGERLEFLDNKASIDSLTRLRHLVQSTFVKIEGVWVVESA